MSVSAPPKVTPISAGKESRKSWLSRLTIFIAWQLVAILFIELFLCWAGLGEEETFKLDSELGSRHMTNKRITWRSEGYAVSYFDADGMREPGLTVAKPAGTYRIALLGDSMAEGLQVPIEESFGQLLAQRLRKQNGKDIQVLNFGTSGYSTAQEYLQLKKQVLKYRPDLVLLCYNSRDIFENWAPPDQVITNVRPLAIHLPGLYLNVSTYPVTSWLKSPRGRFLNSIEWIREHSRLWGLCSALQLEWSFNNPAYRALLLLATQPRKAMNDFIAGLTLKAPTFRIRTFEDKGNNSGPGNTGHQAATTGERVKPSLMSAAPNAVLGNNPLLQKPVQPVSSKVGNNVPPAGKPTVQGFASVNSELMRAALIKCGVSENHPEVQEALRVDARTNYINLITRTLSSLLKEMRLECERHGAQFAVMAIPTRAALCPTAGMETSFAGINYPEEIQMVAKICQKRQIPMYDCQTQAEKLSPRRQRDLFYSVHFTPAGHVFVADTMQDFLARLSK